MLYARMILCLAAAALSGCVAWHGILRPGVRGKVINAVTGRPVPGAVFTLAEVNELPATQVSTLADGSFSIPPFRKWAVFTYSDEYFPTVSYYTVNSPGYHWFHGAFQFNFLNTGNNANRYLGTISLHPR